MAQIKLVALSAYMHSDGNIYREYIDDKGRLWWWDGDPTELPRQVRLPEEPDYSPPPVDDPIS